jgi:HEAT repeats
MRSTPSVQPPGAPAPANEGTANASASKLSAPLSATSATAPQAQKPIQVELNGTRLSVVADKQPLSQVLREVARVTGITVRGAETVPQPISVHFTNLPLEEGLRNMLAGVDYALMGTATTAADFSDVRVVVFKGGELHETGLARATPRTPVISADARRAELLNALRSGDAATQARAFQALLKIDPEGAMDALSSAVADGTGQAQLQALQLLDQAGQADPDSVMSVLGQAMNATDDSVKDYAIQALARREGQVSIDLLRQAMSDPDPSVRLLVVESIAQRDDGRPLLQQALSDSDETVKNSAAALLKSTSGEQNPPDQQPEQPDDNPDQP